MLNYLKKVSKMKQMTPSLLNQTKYQFVPKAVFGFPINMHFACYIFYIEVTIFKRLLCSYLISEKQRPL